MVYKIENKSKEMKSDEYLIRRTVVYGLGSKVSSVDTECSHECNKDPIQSSSQLFR